jgi:hypothetical protein
MVAASPLLWLLWTRRHEGLWLRQLVSFAAFLAMPLLSFALLARLYGSPPFPRSSQALFLLDYEDLFRLGGPDRARFFALPFGEHLSRAASAARAHVLGWSAETRHIGWPVIALLTFCARRERLCAAVLIHFVLVLFVYVVLPQVGVNGGFMRGSAALVPLLVLSAARAIPHLEAVPHFGAIRHWLRVAKVAGLAALFWLAVAGVRRAHDNVLRNNRIGDEAATLAEFIRKDGVRAVVMTRTPWQLALHGVRAVQIPNGDEIAISRVISRYRVTHVVAPAPPLRPWLPAVIQGAGWVERRAPGGERVYTARGAVLRLRERERGR